MSSAYITPHGGTPQRATPPDGSGWAAPPAPVPAAMPGAGGVGLWVFIGVVSMLFFLFSAAYLMRMAAGDWVVLPAPPWQLWCSTALLALGSLTWQLAARTAGTAEAMALSAARPAHAAHGVLVGAACLASLAFLAMQLWAWQAMRVNYPVAANPSNSFFYLITGLHGLHVIGGLLAAGLVWLRARSRGAIALCARYWHFLLVLWLAMFGLLFLITPERVQIICGPFQ